MWMATVRATPWRCGSGRRTSARREPWEARVCRNNRLFWKENKEGAGTSPAPLEMLSLLFRRLATGASRLLRRRFFRGGGLTLCRLLPLRCCHFSPSFGLAGCQKITLATSARRSTRIAFKTRAVAYEGKVPAFSTRFSFITLNARFGHKF